MKRWPLPCFREKYFLCPLQNCCCIQVCTRIKVVVMGRPPIESTHLCDSHGYSWQTDQPFPVDDKRHLALAKTRCKKRWRMYRAVFQKQGQETHLAGTRQALLLLNVDNRNEYQPG